MSGRTGEPLLQPSTELVDGDSGTRGGGQCALEPFPRTLGSRADFPASRGPRLRTSETKVKVPADQCQVRKLSARRASRASETWEGQVAAGGASRGERA